MKDDTFLTLFNITVIIVADILDLANQSFLDLGCSCKACSFGSFMPRGLQDTRRFMAE